MSRPTRALRIYAGPAAREHIRQHGLLPAHIGAIPGAAGGPKGLILGALDRFVFGQWLPQSEQPVHVVGASIGAWRMATAGLNNCVAAFEELEREYIHQHYELPPGQKRPSAEQVSREFGLNLQRFYGGRIDEVLKHPRYRLHVLTSRGKGLLRREHPLGTPLGYGLAFAANAISRRALGGVLERVVFSGTDQQQPWQPPFALDDFPSRQVALTADNFMAAVQASCSIPFALQAVHDIPDAPAGAYWDGGITDYQLHLDYQLPNSSPIVLYPHFQKQVVPGWLDKVWKRRHRATSALDSMVLLAPDPAWVAGLPNGKLPDRNDFMTYATDLNTRVRVWTAAASAAQQLADEFQNWLARPDMGQVEAL
jgi:hypothetical protein